MRRTRVGIAASAVMIVLGAACSTGNTNPNRSDASDSAETADPSQVMTSTPSATTYAGVQIADNPFAGVDAWIAFLSSEGLWLAHPDGTGRSVIDTGVGDINQPDWSPDGSQLAFAANDAIYEYDVDAETTRELFRCERPCLGNAEPAYSPDGERLAFIRYLGPLVNEVPSDCGIWVGELRSGRVRQVTSQTDPPCDPYEHSIDWSPDATSLVYYREIPLGSGDVTSAIYSVAVDGTDERRLTSPDLRAGDPSYSPDGRWIAFNTYLPDLGEGDSQVYRMRPDGSGIEQLTDYGDVRAYQASYSPDGDWIIFSIFSLSEADSHGLWVIPADGGAPTAIPQAFGVQGQWQPTP